MLLSSLAASLKMSLRLHGPRNAGESGALAQTAVVPFVDRDEAPLQSVISLEGVMCTKIPYANRWLAKRALAKLRALGRDVHAVHPCFAEHPGTWHVTSKKTRQW